MLPLKYFGLVAKSTEKVTSDKIKFKPGRLTIYVQTYKSPLHKFRYKYPADLIEMNVTLGYFPLATIPNENINLYLEHVKKIPGYCLVIKRRKSILLATKETAKFDKKFRELMDMLKMQKLVMLIKLRIIIVYACFTKI